MEEKKYDDIKNSKNILEYNIPDKKIKKILYDWLRYLDLEKGFSEKTINAYESDLRKFINFLCWHKKNKITDLSKLNKEKLEKIKNNFDYKNLSLTKNELINIKYNEIRPYLFFVTFLDYKKITRGRIIASIKSFYRFLDKNNIKIDTRILTELKGPRKEKSLPRPINFDGIKNIINEIKNGKKINWIKKRNIAIILIMYGTGLRIDEVLARRYQDIPINYSKCSIKIIAKGKKEKEVLLTPIIMKSINEYINSCPFKFNNETFLFLGKNLKKLDPGVFQRDFRKIGKKLDLYIKRKFTPHALRHSFGTHMLDAGADIRVIQDLMGHKSISSTEIYTEVSQKNLSEQYRKFNPRDKINLKN